MAKKATGKSFEKRADQYMLRFPDGVRDAIAKRAAANGRSVNTEIIAAIEQYLAGADRASALLDFLEAHKTSIENLGGLNDFVEELEKRVDELENPTDPNRD